jgi:hypothetical protein
MLPDDERQRRGAARQCTVDCRAHRRLSEYNRPSVMPSGERRASLSTCRGDLLADRPRDRRPGQESPRGRGDCLL